MKAKWMISSMAFLLIFLAVFAPENRSQSPDDKKPRMVISELEHNFGSIKAGTPLKYTFKVTNKGTANLEVKNVAPSCGCTTSNFDKVVAPGKSGGITLEIEKTDGYKGETTKTAQVTTNDPNRQSFTLTLRADFQ